MNAILHQQMVSKRRRRIIVFRKTRGLLRGLGAAVLAAFCAAALWRGIQSASFFALRTVEVVGPLQKLTMAEILEASGLQKGRNLFSIPLKEVEAGIARLPWVKSVAIRRQVPDVLWIHVKERRAKALLLAEGLHFVSAEGVVFKPVEAERERDFVILTGFKKDQPLDLALQLIDFFESKPDLGVFGLSEIHYNAATGYSIVTLQGPVEVKLGEENFETKLARLPKVWAFLERRLPRLRGIDLNWEEKIFVKL